MKKESINLQWLEGMSFEADVDGFKVSIDADPEFGGKSKGPKPKPLMMVALAGCTGMDVAAIVYRRVSSRFTRQVLTERNRSSALPVPAISLVSVQY